MEWGWRNTWACSYSMQIKLPETSGCGVLCHGVDLFSLHVWAAASACSLHRSVCFTGLGLQCPRFSVRSVPGVLCPALEWGCSSCTLAWTAGCPPPQWPYADRSWGLALVQHPPELFPSPRSGWAVMGTCNAVLWWIKLTLKLFPQSPICALVFTKLQFSVLRAGIFKSVDNA